jgi:hypothetical protein
VFPAPLAESLHALGIPSSADAVTIALRLRDLAPTRQLEERAVLMLALGYLGRGAQWFAEASALGRSLGERDLVALAWLGRGDVEPLEQRRHAYQTALSALEPGGLRNAVAAPGDVRLRAAAHLRLGELFRLRGAPARARAHFAEALRLDGSEPLIRGSAERGLRRARHGAS